MATGYTRLHSGDILTGAVIEAAHFNDEYNAIQAAMNAVTGHDHGGTAGAGAPIALATAVTGTLPIANGGTASTTASDARTALGLAIGTNVQAYSANLTTLAGLTPTANNFITGNGTTWVLTTPANARTALGLGTAALSASTDFLAVTSNLNDLANKGTARTNLGVAIGSDVQAYSAFTAALVALATTGLIARTGSGTVATRTITGPAAGISVANGDGVAGNPTLSLTNDLSALEALSSTGIACRTASDTWAQRTVAAPAAGITVTNPGGVAGNITLALANDLSGLEGLSSTGFAVRTASDTWANRTITVTGSTGLSITNGDGVSGNVVLAGVDATNGGTKGVVALSDNATTATGTSTTVAVTPAAAAANFAYQGIQTIWVPATAMTPNTTNGPASGTTETTTNKIMVKTLDFDASTQETAQFTVAFPKSWNNSTVTAEFFWTATNTGNCVWGMKGLAVSDDDVVDTAMGTGQEVTDGVTATTDLMHSSATAAITIAGTPASGDVVWFGVYRNASSGSDTLAVDARLVGVKVFFTTNAKNDA